MSPAARRPTAARRASSAAARCGRCRRRVPARRGTAGDVAQVLQDGVLEREVRPRLMELEDVARLPVCRRKLRSCSPGSAVATPSRPKSSRATRSGSIMLSAYDHRPRDRRDRRPRPGARARTGAGRRHRADPRPRPRTRRSRRWRTPARPSSSSPTSPRWTQMRALAAALPPVDVLVNNAGLGFGDRREESEDGLELRFQVNYLAGLPARARADAAARRQRRQRRARRRSTSTTR